MTRDLREHSMCFKLKAAHYDVHDLFKKTEHCLKFINIDMVYISSLKKRAKSSESYENSIVKIMS